MLVKHSWFMQGTPKAHPERRRVLAALGSILWTPGWKPKSWIFSKETKETHIKGWNSDNLGQATFAVWIHTDSPINSALLDRFLCLSQHTMVPTSRGRQPWVCKDTSRSQIHSQALWAQAPFSPAPGPQEEQNTLDLGSEGAREVPESQDECRAYMKQHSASGSSDKRWHCLPSELDIFRCHQSKYI